ncbi:synaptonemal complex central element protein 1-like isoform X2 [Arapaima gigas]
MSLSSGASVEPGLQGLQAKLTELLRGNKALAEELRQARACRDTLEKQHEALCAELYQLQGTRNQREDSCKILRFKCEELESDLKREQQLNSKTKELLQQHTFQIQETELKHRKLRMKFENQLQQLMDQHKHLSSVYSPEGLPAEVENAVKAKVQLLKAEELKLTQLDGLSEAPGETGGPDLGAEGAAGPEEAVDRAPVPQK